MLKITTLKNRKVTISKDLMQTLNSKSASWKRFWCQKDNKFKCLPIKYWSIKKYTCDVDRSTYLHSTQHNQMNTILKWTTSSNKAPMFPCSDAVNAIFLFLVLTCCCEGRASLMKRSVLLVVVSQPVWLTLHWSRTHHLTVGCASAALWIFARNWAQSSWIVMSHCQIHSDSACI